MVKILNTLPFECFKENRNIGWLYILKSPSRYGSETNKFSLHTLFCNKNVPRGYVVEYGRIVRREKKNKKRSMHITIRRIYCGFI